MSSSTVNPKNGVVIENEKSKTLKILSNRTGTHYYQSRDEGYYRDYYHEHKERVTCEYCERQVYANKLKIHLASVICQRWAARKNATPFH